MTNPFTKAYEALVTSGYPVIEQGTIPAGEVLPETFCTYQIISSDSKSYADGQVTGISYRVQANLYSEDPAIVQTAEGLIRSLMTAAGFMRAGGRSLPYDSSQGHYGYTCDYTIYDSEV